jgi:spore maturation protein CgeB
MKFALFYHSLISDWNHGNAHFLRGVVAELLARGHEVRVFEPADAWSVQNMVRDHGPGAITAFRRAYPELDSTRYGEGLDLEVALDGVDVVIIHEWNDPALVARIGQHRAHHHYVLLFHDTHHRSVTAPDEIARYDLRHCDGVLAFGEAVAARYRARGQRAWTWHEAADIRRFGPRPDVPCEGDLVWIGNWGDDERTAELHAMLLRPVARLALRAHVHGVRYPAEALADLTRAGITYRGWLPNFEVPDAFARHRVTIHVPRRPYVKALPGIPTIRMFEALACGIPLVSAPWDDREQLFTAGKDYVLAHDSDEMTRMLGALVHDREWAAELAAHGRATILARHTCGHRVTELEAIIRQASH